MLPPTAIGRLRRTTSDELRRTASGLLASRHPTAANHQWSDSSHDHWKVSDRFHQRRSSGEPPPVPVSPPATGGVLPPPVSTGGVLPPACSGGVLPAPVLPPPLAAACRSPDRWCASAPVTGRAAAAVGIVLQEDLLQRRRTSSAVSPSCEPQAYAYRRQDGNKGRPMVDQRLRLRGGRN